MSRTQAYQYDALPQGAMPQPSAVYAAATSGVGGHDFPVAAKPVRAANEAMFSPVNVDALPPQHVQWMQPAVKPEGAAGGDIGTAGVRLAGAATGLATGTKLATKALGETMGASAGAVGAVSAGFDVWAGARDRKDAMGQMLEMYAPVIAQEREKELGRPLKPEELNEDALRRAAENNKVLEQAVKAYDGGVWRKPAITLASSVVGGAAAAQVGGALALATGPVGWVAGIGTMIATSMLANKVLTSVAGPQEVSDTIHAKVLELRQKTDAGEQLSAKDVFSLHARMNGSIQKRVHEKFGTRNFDELKVEQQAQVMGEYKNEMPLMQQEAFLVNAGFIRPEMTAFVPLNAVAASMQPTMSPEAELPMTPPITQVMSSGAQVEYMQPRQQSQAQSASGHAASVAAQRAQATNADTLNQRA
jgi:hypothetical protein